MRIKILESKSMKGFQFTKFFFPRGDYQNRIKYRKKIKYSLQAIANLVQVEKI